MAITATRTYEDYEKEQMDKAIADVNERSAVYKANSDKTLSQISAAIDKSAKTAAGVYQNRIDGADALYKKQYADNAIAEAFAREQIKNSMAASGMTDSGQNLTMQTALAAQKNNRDNEVSESKRNYVREMQDAIDAVMANAESQKAEQQISAEKDVQNYYDTLYNNAVNSARSNAAELYNADLSAQQEAYKAEQEAYKAQQEAYYDTLLKLSEKADKTAENRQAYALNMMKNMGYSEEHAWAAAYARYPSEDENTNAYYTLYRNAMAGGMSEKEANAYAAAGGGDQGNAAVSELRMNAASAVVGNKNMFDGNGKVDGWYTGYKPASYDGHYVYDQVTKQLNEMPAYAALSDAEKSYAQAIAIGNTLSQHWARDIKKGKTDKMLQRLNGMADRLNDTQYQLIAGMIGLQV